MKDIQSLINERFELGNDFLKNVLNEKFSSEKLGKLIGRGREANDNNREAIQACGINWNNIKDSQVRVIDKPERVRDYLKSAKTGRCLYIFTDKYDNIMFISSKNEISYKPKFTDFNRKPLDPAAYFMNLEYTSRVLVRDGEFEKRKKIYSDISNTLFEYGISKHNQFRGSKKHIDCLSGAINKLVYLVMQYANCKAGNISDQKTDFYKIDDDKWLKWINPEVLDSINGTLSYIDVFNEMADRIGYTDTGYLKDAFYFQSTADENSDRGTSTPGYDHYMETAAGISKEFPMTNPENIIDLLNPDIIAALCSAFLTSGDFDMDNQSVYNPYSIYNDWKNNNLNINKLKSFVDEYGYKLKSSDSLLLSFSATNNSEAFGMTGFLLFPEYIKRLYMIGNLDDKATQSNSTNVNAMTNVDVVSDIERLASNAYEIKKGSKKSTKQLKGGNGDAGEMRATISYDDIVTNFQKATAFSTDDVKFMKDVINTITKKGNVFDGFSANGDKLVSDKDAELLRNIGNTENTDEKFFSKKGVSLTLEVIESIKEYMSNRKMFDKNSLKTMLSIARDIQGKCEKPTKGLLIEPSYADNMKKINELKDTKEFFSRVLKAVQGFFNAMKDEHEENDYSFELSYQMYSFVGYVLRSLSKMKKDTSYIKFIEQSKYDNNQGPTFKYANIDSDVFDDILKELTSFDVNYSIEQRGAFVRLLKSLKGMNTVDNNDTDGFNLDVERYINSALKRYREIKKYNLINPLDSTDKFAETLGETMLNINEKKEFFNTEYVEKISNSLKKAISMIKDRFKGYTCRQYSPKEDEVKRVQNLWVYPTPNNLDEIKTNKLENTRDPETNADVLRNKYNGVIYNVFTKAQYSAHMRELKSGKAPKKPDTSDHNMLNDGDIVMYISAKKDENTKDSRGTSRLMIYDAATESFKIPVMDKKHKHMKDIVIGFFNTVIGPADSSDFDTKYINFDKKYLGGNLAEFKAVIESFESLIKLFKNRFPSDAELKMIYGSEANTIQKEELTKLGFGNYKSFVNERDNGVIGAIRRMVDIYGEFANLCNEYVNAAHFDGNMDEPTIDLDNINDIVYTVDMLGDIFRRIDDPMNDNDKRDLERLRRGFEILSSCVIETPKSVFRNPNAHDRKDYHSYFDSKDNIFYFGSQSLMEKPEMNYDLLTIMGKKYPGIQQASAILKEGLESLRTWILSGSDEQMKIDDTYAEIMVKGNKYGYSGTDFSNEVRQSVKNKIDDILDNVSKFENKPDDEETKDMMLWQISRYIRLIKYVNRYREIGLKFKMPAAKGYSDNNTYVNNSPNLIYRWIKRI